MIWSILLAGIIVFIYPGYLLLTAKKTFAKIKSGVDRPLKDYKATTLIIWTLTVLVLINHVIGNPPKFHLFPTVNVYGIAFLFCLLLIVFIQFRSTKITSENFDVMHKKFREILFYLPGTKKELNWFIVLSFTAGIGEEIIFRLFVFHFITDFGGIFIGFILTNLLFAFTHIGSGSKNMINTFILGLIFSASYYFSDNIWIAVLLHIVIDLHAGIIGYHINKFALLLEAKDKSTKIK